MKRQKVDHSADDMLKAFEYKLYSMKAQSTTNIPEDADVIEAPEEVEASWDDWNDEPEDAEYHDWKLLRTKEVRDSDGFMTEYAMYLLGDGTYGFVFGDTDIYNPDTSFLDYVCDTKEEALNWFDNYTTEDDE